MLFRFLVVTGLVTGLAHPAKAAIDVVTSIKPVHSLVAAVMEGAGEPSLLVDGNASPHGYSLKPSQARMLENAGIVFWIGPDLEQFLEKPLAIIGGSARSVALEEAPGVILYDVREGGAFAAHDHDHHDDHADGHHDDHADDQHDEHADDHHDEHADGHHDEHANGHHDEHAENDHHETGDHAEADHHDETEHEENDPHIWLDPVNAIAMARQIAEVLENADPANAALYQSNLDRLEERLTVLVESVQKQLAPFSEQQFIAFHDAYRYFEERFGIRAAGSITVTPDIAPGAERITEIRARIKELQAACVFAEPQFPPAMVSVVTEGTDVKTAVLDPLGSNIESGPEFYVQLVEALANAIDDCLSASASGQ